MKISVLGIVVRDARNVDPVGITVDVMWGKRELDMPFGGSFKTEKQVMLWVLNHKIAVVFIIRECTYRALYGKYELFYIHRFGFLGRRFS